jgi:hypothetical protein
MAKICQPNIHRHYKHGKNSSTEHSSTLHDFVPALLDAQMGPINPSPLNLRMLRIFVQKKSQD